MWRPAFSDAVKLASPVSLYIALGLPMDFPHACCTSHSIPETIVVLQVISGHV